MGFNEDVVTFDLELTISGLVVIALKSSEEMPENPEAVDIILPNADMHRPRLSYLPLEGRPSVEPEMAVDCDGSRISSLDLRSRFLDLTLTNSPHQQFKLKWAQPDVVKPSNKKEEKWMNWVPTLGELGFYDFTMPPAGLLPAGASTRIKLPPGELVARKVIRNKSDSDYLVWRFPATSRDKAKQTKRSVANEVVFCAYGVETVRVNDQNGDKFLTASANSGVLRMSISHDLAMVPKEYAAGTTALKHLEHLKVLAKLTKPFKPPEVVDSASPGQRTGDPICDGARMVYRG